MSPANFVTHTLIPAAQILMLTQTALANAVWLRRDPNVKKANAILSNEGFRALHLLATQAQLASIDADWPFEGRHVELAEEAVESLVQSWCALLDGINASTSTQSKPNGFARALYDGCPLKAQALSKLNGLQSHAIALPLQTRRIIQDQVLPAVHNYHARGQSAWIRDAMQKPLLGGSINGWLTLARNMSWEQALQRIAKQPVSQPAHRNRFASHQGKEAAPMLLAKHFRDTLQRPLADLAPQDLLPRFVSVRNDASGQLVLEATYRSQLRPLLLDNSKGLGADDARFLAEHRRDVMNLRAPEKLIVTGGYSALPDMVARARAWHQDAAAKEAPLLEKYQAHRAEALKNDVEARLRKAFSPEELEVVRALFSVAQS